MLIYSGEKPFNCTQCSYSCAQAESLKKHMFIHSGEKPFRCEQCNYSCTQGVVLNRHKLKHIEEKPFECNQCSFQSSNQSNSVKYHMFSHTGEKPFACKQCNYSCKTSYLLKMHMRKHSWKNKRWKSKNVFFVANIIFALFD